MLVRSILTLAAALAVGPIFAQQQPPPNRVAPRGQTAAAPGGALSTVKDRASYSFGMMIGTNLKKQGVDVDLNLFVQGLRDATGGKVLLTEEQAGEAIAAFEQAMIAKKAKESQAFMAQNGKRQGVQTTSSGLQYKVLKAGTGPKPTANDAVEVIYRGMFVNGDEFDSSQGKPYTIGVGDVITGWKEALQLMPLGSKWMLFIPAELAYGAEGRAPVIGPNMALVFELELVNIAKAPATGSLKSRPRAEPVR